MPTSAVGATPTVLSRPGPSPRHRFTLRAEGGFLAATPGLSGPPVAMVPNPADAVHFVDFDAALHRAHLMTEVGWQNLRVVEILVASP